ncbi:adenosine deaminase [Marinomonas colpomeniae]|uniref:Adenine deaminase n=1 Tax=Marinomonas colpomeniae TaxID=2774408 RepID=A0ABR8NZK4_9GAMM|nr:adenosine deaminase [Marinomonas colpomeniae]MBD5771476.1 adenosine deaminase [Marinomonas colpomeniae]
MENLQDFIEGMPKCELHVHVEGTLEPEMKFELAKRNNIELPYANIEALKNAYDFDDLPSFLAIYYEGMNVLLTEQDFFDLTYAYLVKAHSQNVLYTEMFFDPQAHTARGVGFDTVIRGIRRAQIAAETSLGIRSQLIMCFLRDWSAEFAMTTLLQSLPYKEWIIGVGLDSDERNNPPMKFNKVFQRAREEGYLLTVHCDVNQQGSIQHIWQAVNDIGADRLDHGVNAIEDKALCEEIKKRSLALTMCPISNAYVVGGTKADVLDQMLDLGMRVTVNSDDPAYFPGYMNENLIRLQEEVNLGKDKLVQLTRNAFEGAWLPRATKDRYLAELEDFAV